MSDLPSSESHEMSVLATMLAFPWAIDDFPEVTSDHFANPVHRQTFIRAQEFWSRRIEGVETLDQIGVGQAVCRDIPGPETISRLIAIRELGAIEDHMADHVTELRHQLARRKAVALARELDWRARNAENASDIIAVTSGPVTEIHDEIAGCKPARSSGSLIRSIVERIERLMVDGKKKEGIAVSIPEIQRRFGGLNAGHTIIVSGYPGTGKSVLMGQFLSDAALGGEAALYCTLEMTDEQVMERVLAYAGKLPACAITDPITFAREYRNKSQLCEMDRRIITDAGVRVKNSPLAIEECGGFDAYQIAATIRRKHRKQPLKAVAIDFLQLVKAAPENRKESREQQMSHAANMFAAMAKEMRFTLLVGSQLSKDGATKHAEAINEAADLHLMILKDNKGIGIPKDRHFGQQGNTIANIVLRPDYLRFEEQSKQTEPTQPRY